MKRFFSSSIIVLLSVLHIESAICGELPGGNTDLSSEEGLTFAERLIPHYLKGQYAGSIGAGSVGVGWVYGGADQFDTDLSVGFVPKGAYDRIMTVLSLKASYTPWVMDLDVGSYGFAVSPLICGLYISYICDTEDDLFWVKESEEYYRFSTQVRINLFMGQSVTHYMRRNIMGIKSITPYYELSISDLNLANKFTNSTLKLRDLLSLGFGVKFHFR